MFWSLRRFVFLSKNPGVFFKQLSQVSDGISVEKRETSFSFSRIDTIDSNFEKKITEVLASIDYKPPFSLEDASSRLNRGELFVVIYHDVEIAGWGWFALAKAECEEFNCSIKIRDGQAYAYNIFVNKKYRGNDLATHLLTSSEPYLRQLNVDLVWAIIYDWNVPSQKAFVKAGYEKIGYYKMLNVLGVKFHHCPDIIKG
ncbi:N-acetyltransferase family protein [Trichloromonas sp.]|uniref:GNAT family N-acetyltransferase n=1 Tax=Trichloromonas sp. TaxID=3069249 RepID=UPI003D812DFC